MMKKQKAPEMKKHRKVCSKGDIAFNIVNYTVFFLITLACVFPFYYLFINTISSNELVRLGKIQLYPQEIHFETSTTHYYIKPRPFVLAVLNPRRQTLAACA